MCPFLSDTNVDSSILSVIGSKSYHLHDEKEKEHGSDMKALRSFSRLLDTTKSRWHFILE